jgi:hypothetical protein
LFPTDRARRREIPPRGKAWKATARNRPFPPYLGHAIGISPLRCSPFPLPKASRQSERNKSNWNRLEAAKPPWLFRFYHASHTPIRFANANTWLRRQRVRQGLVLRWLGGIAWTSKVGLIFDRVPRILVRERLSDGLIGSFVATPSLIRNWHALEARGIACFPRASPSPSL